MTPLSQASIEEAFKSDEILQRSAADIAKDIEKATYDISVFVENLGFALTSPDVELRVNGTKLLSGVLSDLPKDLLNATQLEFLVTFYTNRLKDHHNVMPAVIDGLTALFVMKQLPREAVPKLLHTFFQHISCQSQVRSDRVKIYKMLKRLSEDYATELKSMGGDFMYNMIEAIEGERDPRNLEFIFTFMPDFIANYPLLHLSEEMFEAFACYFPIDFNPFKDDTMTRESLAEKLANCLVAAEDFVEWAVALGLEKLESDLVVAKLDALDLLNRAALKFSPKALEPHFESIWTALKKHVLPGVDNEEIVTDCLKLLRSILERAAAVPEISHNHQLIVLGAILPHLDDATHRFFHPATSIAMICVAGDPQFASTKVLGTFFLKLKAGELDVEQRIKIYNNVAKVFKIVYLRNSLQNINGEICTQLHELAIADLRLPEDETEKNTAGVPVNLDLLRAALSALNESVPIISEVNRALIYKLLVQFTTHSSIELDLAHLLEQLGALYPIELQSHFIDACIRNFPIFSNNIKRKIFTNLLPLVRQIAFTDRILGLGLSNVFQPNAGDDVRLIALEALNAMLAKEDKRLIKEIQETHCLIDKLIKLAQQGQHDLKVLEQIAAALSLIMQQLELSEQYMIATTYLPQLNLQVAADLYVAKGLLAFLHEGISLDDHFERLCEDLTNLSLQCDDEVLREVAHHLLCSLWNKIDYNTKNRNIALRIIDKLKVEIKRGNERAVQALSWLAKALTVRGSEDAGDIFEALAELLEHPTLSHTAVLAFDIISTEYAQLHLPIVKYLYQQKYFQMVLKKLGKKLQSYAEHHLNAFVYVLKATPHAVLKMNMEQVGPILFKCLESNKTHTLCISLGICENFIRKQDEYFRSHLNHIIPSCLQLSRYTNSMQVRITALKVLQDIIKYPTFVLLPYKTDIVLELAGALDDPKRLVRNEAVIARNLWFLLGSPNANEN